jgi:polysaccharide chain length determinant protein (PEP-CTERM system associated)
MMKMRSDDTKSEINRVFEIVWSRKWVILITFLVIFTSVALWGLYQPNLYQSSATIFIEPQEVPSDYVRSTITTDLDARLRTVTQQMTNRIKLTEVIDELDLYPEMREKGMPPEVLVARMRQDLSIETPPARRGPADYFQVTYIHAQPNKAMLAVSKLISLFIEDSLQIRAQQAQETTSFIEEELSKLKTVLEEQESAIQEYKREYMGELPDQLEANLRMLDNLQMQLSDSIESQDEVGDRIMLLEREISRLEGQIRVAGSIGNVEEEEQVGDATLNQLMEQRDVLRQRITNLESMFTEKHPDVITAKRELAKLEERLKTIMDNLASSQEQGDQPVVTPISGNTLEMANLRRQLTEIKPRLRALQKEETDLRRRIKEYQRRVEVAPEREQRLLQLTRDYDNTTRSYEDLLNKKLEAQLSENLEKRQKGENFRILDPANYPQKPFLPDRQKIISLGFIGGLGAGFGLAFLLETLFPAFTSLKQLQNFSELDITFGIPYIPSASERRRHIQNTAILICAALVVLLLTMALLDRYVIDLRVFAQTIGNNLKGMM